MTTEEYPEQPIERVAEAIITPEDQTVPFGDGDTLAHYHLYQPMRETGSVDRMIEVIDYTEPMIDKTETENEYNQLKIARLAALVADMPDTLPLEERTRAWRHFISADWVHMYSDTYDVDRVITTVAREDTELGNEIRNVQNRVFEEKLTAFTKKTGEIPRFMRESLFSTSRSASRDDWLPQAMDGYDHVRKRYPDALPAYNTLVILAMSGHRSAIAV
jgi:hypothetical protein